MLLVSVFLHLVVEKQKHASFWRHSGRMVGRKEEKMERKDLESEGDHTTSPGRAAECICADSKTTTTIELDINSWIARILTHERLFCNVPAESVFSGLDSLIDPEPRIQGVQAIGPLIYQTSCKVAAPQSLPLNDHNASPCPLLILLCGATKSQEHRRTSSLLWNCPQLLLCHCFTSSVATQRSGCLF